VSVRGYKGVTLVELLVAVAIASVLILAAVAAFQTTQRTAAIGEARENIYQNARVALDLMAKEIKNAYIDSRNRDLVFVSADGLAGRGNSILEYHFDGSDYITTARGLGNAQTPLGIYTTKYDSLDTTAIELYADATFRPPTWSMLSVKAVNDIYTLAPGPPDRLDFTCFASNLPMMDPSNEVIPRDESRLAEVRYMVTTETFVDDEDNDGDGQSDEDDNVPPVGAGLQRLGDMIGADVTRRDDFHPETGKILDLNLFHLRRSLQVYTTKNPFSGYDYLENINTPTYPGDVPDDDPYGRYPARHLHDFVTTNSVEDAAYGRSGDSIGSYIYDLQFEFYGKIAIALDSEGAPEVWGIGWGYQDVRGEDIGTDRGLTGNDRGARAIQSGSVSVVKGRATVNENGTSWPATDDILVGGTFMVWPSSPPTGYTFDTTDPANDVYTIIDSTQTTITLDRQYAKASGSTDYRIIEPTQANGILDVYNGSQIEDRGADGITGDPLDNLDDDGNPYDDPIRVPNNVSDNDGNDTEQSIGEGNKRLDSRVMGIWDSRSPDPRNPRKASELNGWDDNENYETLAYDGLDNDEDGETNDRLDHYYDKDGNSVDKTGDEQYEEYAMPEIDNPEYSTTITAYTDEANDLLDSDQVPEGSPMPDGVVDDRFYEPAGRPEGIDEPSEANPHDDSLPKAVRITIAVSDPAQTLEPVVLSTVVWLSTAR